MDEDFARAVRNALGDSWWDVRDLFRATLAYQDLWPTSSATGLGQWLSRRVGLWAGDLLLEKQERENWSALYRLRTLDEVLTHPTPSP